MHYRLSQSRAIAETCKILSNGTIVSIGHRSTQSYIISRFLLHAVSEAAYHPFLMRLASTII